ncbi:uncharacterized protein BX664DRAFT_361909 [Halteromyces radiatus]|uniref:uncharacterized protein n=1 Tax=Halteromyces radiatus TaxID=101107 RepID=UPI002220A1C0|nr:uncharacterized protein BX664DRAFT_361909 [Halteromyces radiatus]KAI8079730.1 hypothetical protein BX664DRAFT_361909 [Halteromyces radiatus]
MKFSLIAVATLAIAGMASAVHPTHACTKVVDVAQGQTVADVANIVNVPVEDLIKFNHGLQLDSVVPVKSLCVAASKSNAKRCLAEKKVQKKKPSNKKKPSTKKPSSNKKKPSSTPTKAPSNAVRHIVPNCNKYATVLPSDADCTSFSKRNGIKESDLYKWNKGLHHAGDHLCDNLDTGKAYCVGVKN